MTAGEQRSDGHDQGGDAGWLRDVLRHHPGDLVGAAQEIQRQRGFLSQDVLVELARATGRSLAQVYGVVSFYASLSLQPRGRLIVRVCQGTACHVRGASRVTDAVAEHLHVAPGGTTQDMHFTLQAVACLGCCSLAPVMTVGRRTLARVDRAHAVQVLTQTAAAQGDDDDLLGLGDEAMP